MEILKNEKDVPTLISNLEVMFLLSKKLQDRHTTMEQSSHPMQDDQLGTDIQLNSNYNHQKQTALQNRKFRHRNYVEEMVVDYVQSTACGNIDLEAVKDLHTLVSRLKRKPKSKRLTMQQKENGTTSHSNNNNGIKFKEDPSANGSTHTPTLNDESNSTSASSQSASGEGFGLTDGEVVQVLNLVPRESVEIHLIVEDLTSRLSETRQEELLNVIANSCLGKSIKKAENTKDDLIREEEDQNNEVVEDSNIEDIWDKELGEFAMET